MGEHATAVQARLRDELAERRPDREWRLEHSIAGTRVDIAGVGGPVCLVELEWRRADPADNTAKLFRHIADGRLPQGVVVAQVFTSKYDLMNGGVNSRRKNAEFVGRVAADTFDHLAYHPVELAIDPPKRGGDLPAEWEPAVETVAAEITGALD